MSRDEENIYLVREWIWILKKKVHFISFPKGTSAVQSGRSFGTCMCGKVRQTRQGVGCYIKKERRWNVKKRQIHYCIFSFKNHKMYSQINNKFNKLISNFPAGSNRLYYYSLFFFLLHVKHSINTSLFAIYNI